MKLAITGKGGVGKTTLAAILTHLYAEEGRDVIAVDADPDANLASALGMTKEEAERIQPITAMTDLIEERTGARPGSFGAAFSLNPKVDDLPEGIGYRFGRILLLAMGKVKEAGSGCYCPENVLLRSLLRHLIVKRSEVVIVDMEAGIEHLTRGTAEAVDAFIVVVEPGQRSIQTAQTVFTMARQLGVKKVFVVANKVRGERDEVFIAREMNGPRVIGSIRYRDAIVEADMKGLSPYAVSRETNDQVRAIKKKIEDAIGQTSVESEATRGL